MCPVPADSRDLAPIGRQILNKLIADTLRFTARSNGRERWFEFEGEGTQTKLLVGSEVRILVAAPTGLDPRWTREIPG